MRCILLWYNDLCAIGRRGSWLMGMMKWLSRRLVKAQCCSLRSRVVVFVVLGRDFKAGKSWTRCGDLYG